MRDNQMGRRNLSAAWRIELQLANKEDLAKVGAAKKVEAGKEARDKQLGVLSQNDNTPEPKHNTRTEIAKSANTSAGMVGMADDSEHVRNLPEKYTACCESGNLAKNRPPQIDATAVLGVG